MTLRDCAIGLRSYNTGSLHTIEFRPPDLTAFAGPFSSSQITLLSGPGSRSQHCQNCPSNQTRRLAHVGQGWRAPRCHWLLLAESHLTRWPFEGWWADCDAAGAVP